MEVPFDLLGTVYHQVIIIILLLRMASTNSKSGFCNISHILDQRLICIWTSGLILVHLTCLWILISLISMTQ
jgi:hypothetical protein